ncbi:phosphoketolase family protein [Tengunoibacter tsumagoiensis]|uniref:Putative phosphoketolase n=1 Tax=Tengunoibacter tsumagoiensis TaxID=2014871 RepID=A0A402A7C7_9CHLR|nr:phosphoketolase family protein [Tengunoibacter tsumagoiensis]GCE14911.1 putative phosphoketolase [Tengunoibacter tsumagoiensis]
MVIQTTGAATRAGFAASPLEEREELALYQRTTNYLTAAQIYLQENFLLREPLKPEHIKDRLLGHWGTCPGINMIYAHLNRLIIRHNIDMFLITGPGHGAPANLANLYLEGSLQPFYPELTLDEAGLGTFIKRFSWPDGFPSHLYPGLPGTIHEGGELGYSLATAFGAAMDNPDLIVACIVGDGEAETGPTAAAWHSYKFLHPAESGAVLPILHLNGYKISNPTIYGTMSDADLSRLFTGFGYKVRIIQASQGDARMAKALDEAYRDIRSIQQIARSHQSVALPAWPMLILRSPKGWTGIKQLNGKRIEGSHRSHQVPAIDVKSSQTSLEAVEQWLRSYHPEELFDERGRPRPEVLALCPQGNHRMGSNRHTFGGLIYEPLVLPQTQRFAVTRGLTTSNIEPVAQYVKEIIVNNPQTFRIFCPDELESNLLGAILEVTSRNYQWPVADGDEDGSAQGGRVIEVLSEHLCQAWLQGYLLTGRHGLFPSYEAFLNIISSMMDQYAKFLKSSQEFAWRLPVASLNYLQTSTLWRQEHNGFSHQNPGFINTLLNKKPDVARIYLPADANCVVYTMDQCLQDTDTINLIIAEKRPFPQWLSFAEAVAHCRAGASVWQWASTAQGIDPHVVLVGIGDNPTLEVMAAAQIIRTELPFLRLRVVNVVSLFTLTPASEHPQGLEDDLFEAIFTAHAPVIMNFHGYPSALKQLLFGRSRLERFHINGYCEEGTTTTPFDMHVCNGTDRYHLVIQAIRLAAAHPSCQHIAIRMNELIASYQAILTEHRRFIQRYGKDPDSITQWQWQMPAD